MQLLFSGSIVCVFALLSACAPTIQPTSGKHTTPLPDDMIVYQALWDHYGPNQLHQATQSIDHEGQATFTFVVSKNGNALAITKEQVLPVNADVSALEKLVETSRFLPVYRHGVPLESYQSYTFYYGNMAYLEYWRETCEHEGNRNLPLAQSGIDATYPHFCTRISYPQFAAYRFLLWPMLAACRNLAPLHCGTGTVIVSFRLNPDGHPQDVSVIKSDAQNLMDLAAKSCVENWYFVPRRGMHLSAQAKYSVTLVYQQ